MFMMPVMNAILTAALKPIRANAQRPRKLSIATPSTSISRPTKYLDRRCSISPMASITLVSMLSGTIDPTIFLNNIGSLVKKNEMNTIEKMATPTDTNTEATDSISPGMEFRSNTLLMNFPMEFSTLKSGPN